MHYTALIVFMSSPDTIIRVFVHRERQFESLKKIITEKLPAHLLKVCYIYIKICVCVYVCAALRVTASVCVYFRVFMCSDVEPSILFIRNDRGVRKEEGKAQ